MVAMRLRRSFLMVLAVVVAAWAAPAVAQNAAPKRKDSSARLKPKEVTLTARVVPAQAKPGETVHYEITAAVANPWHIYAFAKEQPKKGPAITQFDFFDPADLTMAGDWKPSEPPHQKAEPAFDGLVVEFHEESVTWSIPLQVRANATPGKRILRCQINFQICDPKQCKPPVRSTLPDVVLTVVEKGAAAVSSGAPIALAGRTFLAGALLAAVTPPVPTKSTPVANPGTVQESIQQGLVPFLLFSAGGGFLALLMPCVWPMVPITVNFFVKQGQHKHGRTTGLAVIYCLSIIGVFTAVGLLCSVFMGASSLTRLANNAWLNLAVALLFLTFGVSLLGLFEIRLPSFLLNASTVRESKGGLIGVMFMALTLTITSFTCTFPVVGGLIVLASRGQFFYPVIGLATFATVLAFPFFLLALAPKLISKMPKSGDWMNAVKVVGGLVEIGAAFKFLNTAEIGFGSTPDNAWFDSAVILSIWVVLSIVCGIYMLGLFRTHHDHGDLRVGPGRILIGALFLCLGLYLAPALFGYPPQSQVYNRLVVGILPADSGRLQRREASAQPNPSPVVAVAPPSTPGPNSSMPPAPAAAAQPNPSPVVAVAPPSAPGPNSSLPPAPAAASVGLPRSHSTTPDAVFPPLAAAAARASMPLALGGHPVPPVAVPQEVRATSKDPKQALSEEKRLHGVLWGFSLDAAIEQAKANKLPVLIDFTGVNCANCRLMEQSVMPRPEVVSLLKRFVTVQLYTDFVPIDSITKEQREDIAAANAEKEIDLTEQVTSPLYVVLDGQGKVLAQVGGYNEPPVFVKFLKGALSKFQDVKPTASGE